MNERVTLTHTLSGVAEYAGSAGPPVAARVPVDAATGTVEDDEEQGLTLNPTAVTMAEDGSATYTVVLTSEPTAPVVVRIGSHNPDVDTQPGLLPYTTSNWGTAQPVTVTQAPGTLGGHRADGDAAGHAGPGGDDHVAAAGGERAVGPGRVRVQTGGGGGGSDGSAGAGRRGCARRHTRWRRL